MAHRRRTDVCYCGRPDRTAVLPADQARSGATNPRWLVGPVLDSVKCGDVKLGSPNPQFAQEWPPAEDTHPGPRGQQYGLSAFNCCDEEITTARQQARNLM